MCVVGVCVGVLLVCCWCVVVVVEGNSLLTCVCRRVCVCVDVCVLLCVCCYVNVSVCVLLVQFDMGRQKER